VALQDFLDALNKTVPRVAAQYGVDPIALLTTMVMAAHLEGGLGDQAGVGDNGASVGRFQYNTAGGHGSTLLRQGYTREQIADDKFQVEDWTPIVARELAAALKSGLTGVDAYRQAIYKAERPRDMYPDDRVYSAANEAERLLGVPVTTGSYGATTSAQGQSQGQTQQQSNSARIGAVLDEMINSQPWRDPNTVAEYAKQNQISTAEAELALRQLWLSETHNLSQLYDAVSQQENNLFQTQDGYIVPLSSMPPEVQDAVRASNENLINKFYNDYQIDTYNLDKDRTQADFTNKVAATDQKMRLDDLRLKQANQAVARALQGKQEASARAKIVQDTLLAAAPWATGGKTEFSPADLGSIGTEWARYAGLPANQPVVRYPGSMTVDPASIIAEYDRQMGVSGAVPDSGSILTGIESLNSAPNLPQPPSLLRPVPVPTAFPQRTSVQPASGGSGSVVEASPVVAGWTYDPVNRQRGSENYWGASTPPEFPSPYESVLPKPLPTTPPSSRYSMSSRYDPVRKQWR
jgi:hypothetical protein